MCRKIFVAFILFSGIVQSNTVLQRLYINRGVFVTVKSTTFPFLAFNKTTSFDQLNEVVVGNIDDTLNFVVINNDTALHGFAIKGTTIASPLILPGDSFTCSLTAASPKAFIYYDNHQYPKNRYLGLAGIIYFGDAAAQTYFWNIKEHQTTYNNDLDAGSSVNWNNYEPDYYTINSKSFPDLQADTMAKVNAQVGDTVFIIVANTGQSAHSLHFHGYHQTCINADAKVIRDGWDKDTWGLFSMDVVVLRMVPDKPGQYAVHDHNLVAITGGNTHPNGMFTIMDVTP